MSKLVFVLDDDEYIRNIIEKFLVYYRGKAALSEPELQALVDRRLAEHRGDVRIVWKHQPLAFHPNALPAAEAAGYRPSGLPRERGTLRGPTNARSRAMLRAARVELDYAALDESARRALLLRHRHRFLRKIRFPARFTAGGAAPAGEEAISNADSRTNLEAKINFG